MGVLELIAGLLTGGLGSIINRAIGIGEKTLERKHELKLFELQMNADAAQREDDRLIADINYSSEIRQASYAHDNAVGGGSKWVRDTLRMVRPALTLLLIFLVWVIWLTNDDAALHEQIVSTVLYMASSALAWWFGDRAMQRGK